MHLRPFCINFLLTKRGDGAIIRETVDAEITAGMPFQRARVAESRVRNSLSNGPRRAQSNVHAQSILRRLGTREWPWSVFALRKGHGFCHECKVAPRINDLFVLDRTLSGTFCFWRTVI